MKIICVVSLGSTDPSECLCPRRERYLHARNLIMVEIDPVLQKIQGASWDLCTEFLQAQFRIWYL